MYLSSIQAPPPLTYSSSAVGGIADAARWPPRSIAYWLFRGRSGRDDCGCRRPRLVSRSYSATCPRAFDADDPGREFVIEASLARRPTPPAVIDSRPGRPAVIVRGAGDADWMCPGGGRRRHGRRHRIRSSHRVRGDRRGAGAERAQPANPRPLAQAAHIAAAAKADVSKPRPRRFIPQPSQAKLARVRAQYNASGARWIVQKNNNLPDSDTTFQGRGQRHRRGSAAKRPGAGFFRCGLPARRRAPLAFAGQPA